MRCSAARTSACCAKASVQCRKRCNCSAGSPVIQQPLLSIAQASIIRDGEGGLDPYIPSNKIFSSKIDVRLISLCARRVRVLAYRPSASVMAIFSGVWLAQRSTRWCSPIGSAHTERLSPTSHRRRTDSSFSGSLQELSLVFSCSVFPYRKAAA
jgi:hypothetical protein